MVTKKDIAENISPLCADAKTASEIVDKVFNFIEDRLAEGEDVRITNFGTFKTVKKAARSGKNPRSGNVIHIPARSVAKFTPGKQLRESVNL